MKKGFRTQLFIVGLMMGVAEIIPGISGGTVAFLSGIYEELLLAIASFHPANLLLLFKGKWKEFDEAVKWRFMFTLLPGMFFSLIAFGHVVHYFLNDPLLRSYLFALFFGFILAASYLSYHRVKKWSTKPILALGCGMLIAFVFTSATHVQNTSLPDLSGDLFWIHGSLILAGMAGITAMLLPGISGSYVLALLGFYPLIISALAHPVEAESLSILFNIGLGVILGGLIFARIIHWVVVRYHDIAIAALTGFIIGAMRNLWPFWIYKQGESPLAGKVSLIPTAPYFPPLDSLSTWSIFATMAAACAIALALEMFALKKKGVDLAADR